MVECGKQLLNHQGRVTEVLRERDSCPAPLTPLGHSSTHDSRLPMEVLILLLADDDDDDGMTLNG